MSPLKNECRGLWFFFLVLKPRILFLDFSEKQQHSPSLFAVTFLSLCLALALALALALVFL